MFEIKPAIQSGNFDVSALQSCLHKSMPSPELQLNSQLAKGEFSERRRQDELFAGLGCRCDCLFCESSWHTNIRSLKLSFFQILVEGLGSLEVSRLF